MAPERDKQEGCCGAADRDDGGGERALAHQKRRQFHDLPGIEEVRRIERVAQVGGLLVADRREQEGDRGNEKDAVVAAAEERVTPDQDQRK
ncbi:hypothetical protein [Mesorhizobium marinum]|uniref:hypothetical protein n=1 Tax=Mesorhizobium marinum TaxID=3228790 RepID=UPI003F5C9FF2